VSPRPTIFIKGETRWLTEICVKPMRRAIASSAFSCAG
jgi:hypothetical protein